MTYIEPCTHDVCGEQAMIADPGNTHPVFVHVSEISRYESYRTCVFPPRRMKL